MSGGNEYTNRPGIVTKRSPMTVATIGAVIAIVGMAAGQITHGTANWLALGVAAVGLAVAIIGLVWLAIRQRQ